jgi:hypothetical protein
LHHIKWEDDVNDEFGRICTKALVVCFMKLHHHLYYGSEENHYKSEAGYMALRLRNLRTPKYETKYC